MTSTQARPMTMDSSYHQSLQTDFGPDFERRTDEVKFTKAEMNNLVMDWLISRGYKNAAETFSQEANMVMPSDHTIEQRVEIRNAINSGDALGAIHLVNELDPYLLENNPKLHFAMLRLHLIELIQSGQNEQPENIMPAIRFSSSSLAPLAAQFPDFIDDLNLVMALLVYPPEKRPAKVGVLLEPSLRQSIAEEVNTIIRGSMGGRDLELIRKLLRARAWSEAEVRVRGQAQNNSLNGGPDAMDSVVGSLDGEMSVETPETSTITASDLSGSGEGGHNLFFGHLRDCYSLNLAQFLGPVESLRAWHQELMISLYSLRHFDCASNRASFFWRAFEAYTAARVAYCQVMDCQVEESSRRTTNVNNVREDPWHYSVHLRHYLRRLDRRVHLTFKRRQNDKLPKHDVFGQNAVEDKDDESQSVDNTETTQVEASVIQL